jgi:hypothetical protein
MRDKKRAGAYDTENSMSEMFKDQPNTRPDNCTFDRVLLPASGGLEFALNHTSSDDRGSFRAGHCKNILDL